MTTGANLSRAKHSAWRRILLIARRDFMGYVMTVGFWLTMLGPLIGIAFGFLGVSLTSLTEPVRYATIIDETGRYADKIIAAVDEEYQDIEAAKLKAFTAFGTTPEQREELDQLIEDQGIEAARARSEQIAPDTMRYYKAGSPPIIIVDTPAPNVEALRPFLLGERQIETPQGPQRLAGVLHITEEAGQPRARYISTITNDSGLVRFSNLVLRREAETAFFESGGLEREAFYDLRENIPTTTQLDPTKPVKTKDGETDETAQAVSIIDNIPYYVAGGAALFLWFTIFSGSYMLLMSMIEEKVNKALEMMLASTRFVEILFGKLLGVAFLTLVSMLPWILLGGIGLLAVLATGQAGVFNAILAAFTPQLIGAMLLFMVLGYLFYGALFMALGSLAESMQDSQTLVTPVILLLTVCMLVVPVGMRAPDSPLVDVASYIPFSAPFAMIVRIPAGVSAGEIALSAGLLALSTLLLTWGASKIFQYGILTGGGVGALKAMLPFGKKRKS